jgi:predicted Zn-dependent protease with MMP-like domain
LRFLSHWDGHQADQERPFDSEAGFKEAGFLAQGGRQETQAAMTREYFRELVEEAIDTIPLKFARQVRNLAIVIEDEPSEELLDEMEIDEDGVLLGLYQGTPLNERGWGYGNQLPDRIVLFQNSIEDDCDDDEDEIIIAIGETLIHELGHYFGMSEEEIMEIEERYWRGEPDPSDLQEVGDDAPMPPERGPEE